MTGMILPMIDRLRRIVLLRYLLASVGALAVDMGSFLALLALGVMPVLASAAGYSLGIVAHWVLSSRAVFADSVSAERVQRTRQKALFVGSALIGLALTTMIVGAGTAAGLDSRLSKIVAIGASFTVTWLLRKRVVFQ
ncbi:GtrA family protein [Novosphingobium sp. MMS21-SN21R]|uniref:GtrA family protein n=1 Tax=Novosphingobium sp. MMS21-SN21R TaxID=2969298 RepID=UPI0028861E87|nr:GtrA family protein [Novosphingobium sp. MMS21-SN21R]MDT0506446.1 GtrA family protein [Novosphingobium sp. MMS21-SN21R]